MNMAMNKIRWTFVLLLCFGMAHAQDEAAEKAQQEAEKALRESTNLTWEANKELTANDFVGAEAEYRKAISKSGKNAAAPYNLGNAYYNRESYGEAFGRYKQAGDAAEDKAEKHKAFHNLGNTYMNEKKYTEAVESYKNALRNNPNDDETRYNLALAKDMLEKNPPPPEDKDDKKKDQNEDKKDQDKKDQQDQDDKNKEGDKGDENKDKDKGDQKEDQKEGDKDKDQGKPDKPKDEEGDKPQQQQPVPGQLSPQQVKSLLEAMNNEEKKTQDKINAEKQKGAKVKTEKDW